MGSNSLTGVVINNRYRVERQLGEGAQGAVFKVRDLLELKRRALKLCSTQTSLSLEIEFLNLFEMHHPNLAKVFDFQLVNHVSPEGAMECGVPFFTEEFVEGELAEQYVGAQPLSKRVAAVAQIGIGVSRALRMLHSRGILHLDVKPSNIIVDSAGSPRLIDLGLARSRESAVGAKVGTLGYMANEVYEGLADERTDVYALGQVLIQLLSQSSPSLRPGAKPSIPEFVPPRFVCVLKQMTENMLEKRFSARESILAIVKSGVVGSQNDGQYLDDTSNADDALSRYALARSTHFVGRESQLDQLSRFFQSTFSSDGAAVCVVNGPVGIGKTRLVRKVVASTQLAHAHKNRSSINFLSGSIRAIAGRIQNVVDSDGVPALRQWLKSSDNNRADMMAGGYMSEKAMGHLLRALAALQGPTVVLVEEATVSLAAMALYHVQESAEFFKNGLALIFELSNVALSAVPDGAAEFIDLKPLSLLDETAMVEGITGVSQPEDVMELFHRRTGGNPRFAEALVEQFVRWDEAHLFEKSQFNAELPDGPEQVVAKKLLATASPAHVQLLSMLSITTAPIGVEELVASLKFDNPEIAETFVFQMKQAGYLHLEQGKISLVAFVANGIRRCIDDEKRLVLHRKLLAGLSKERPPEQLGIYAFGAKQYDVAARYLREAVDMAVASGRLLKAIDFLEMLHLCLPIEKASLSLELATCYRRAGKYSDALRLVEELLHSAPSDSVLLEKAATLRLDGDSISAQQILGSLVDADDALVSSTARSLCARIHLDNGELSLGLDLLKDVVLDEESAHQSGLLNVLGLLHLTSGHVDEAQSIFERGLNVVAGKSPIEEGRYYSYLGMVDHAREDWINAAIHYEKAFRFADECGDSHGAATYVVNWAAALTELGNVKHALLRYRNGMNRLRLVGRREELVQTESNYAQLLLRLGDVAGATVVMKNALAGLSEKENPLVYGNALTVNGETLVANGEPARAVEVLQRAKEIFESRSQRARQDYCLLHMADAYLQQGKTGAAAYQFEQIEDLSVMSSYEYLSLRVQLARQGKGSIRAAVDQLLLSLPRDAVELNFEHYKALSVATLTLRQLEDDERWPVLLRYALDLLGEIRRRTPAVHRPSTYPFETQLREINKKTTQSRTTHVSNSTEVSMRHLWMERLMRITARLNSEQQVDAQLDIIMDTAIDVTDAERGFLLLREVGGGFSVRSARNMDSEALLQQERNYSGTIARRAFAQGEPIVTTNAQEDEQYKDYRSITTLNLMYIVAIPLLVKGKAQGTIYLDSTSSGRFDKERIELLKMLANQAAIALTNSKLVTSVQQRNDQIAELNRQLSTQLAHAEKELAQTRRDLREMNEYLASKYNFFGIIGASKSMKEMFRVLERIAPTDIPVVIGGESGTGKELVAKAIHFAGTRKEKPFVAENCAAMPSQLLESILFGHVRGAFTGAVSNRNGLFVEAHGGTLFLDEIADMPLEMQSKLLRVLQDGEIRPVGQNSSIRVDVRILVASNTNLKKLVKTGKFREDLFYRLHVIEIQLPPLRDRGEDIAILANFFLKKHAPERKIAISTDAIEVLMQYRWPGNVRQLENEVIRATVMCQELLDVEHLSEEVRDYSFGGVEELEDFTLDAHVNRLKKQLIKAALRKCNGNRSKSSELLGISRFGLQKMMTRLDLVQK